MKKLKKHTMVKIIMPVNVIILMLLMFLFTNCNKTIAFNDDTNAKNNTVYEKTQLISDENLNLLFSNVGVTVDGIQVKSDNFINSMVRINDIPYYSFEILKAIIGEDSDITVDEDNVIYILKNKISCEWWMLIRYIYYLKIN